MVLRVLRVGTTRYHRTLWVTTSCTTKYYEVLRVILRVTTSCTMSCTTSHYEYYERFKVLRLKLRVTTRYYERFKVLRVVFRGITMCQLHRLATTFFMNKIKVVFMMSSGFDIICFCIIVSSISWANAKIISCHENKQKC